MCFIFHTHVILVYSCIKGHLVKQIFVVGMAILSKKKVIGKLVVIFLCTGINTIKCYWG